MALPFTSPEYHDIQRRVDELLRRMLAVPPHFDILYMAGGASAQFALVPLNLLGQHGQALYIDSGHWARRAIGEARRYGSIAVINADASITDSPAPEAAVYCHYTSNETANGLQFHRLPVTPLPLVADMTSDLLTALPDWSRHGLVYAGTQKTLGVPGLCIVIVRHDLITTPHPLTPRVMSYEALSSAASRLCTPPVFAMYAALCMLEWIMNEGGVAAMRTRLTQRAQAVYQCIDDTPGLYRCSADRAWRSLVNPCFDLPDETTRQSFFDAAQTTGLRNMAGHPDVGGVRVSLYNGLPDKAVNALTTFMRTFAQDRRAH